MDKDINTNGFIKKIFAVADFLGRIDTIVAAASMFLIACISIWGVITRYILNNPAGWVEELSLALFVWLTFFGISILARRKEIVAIEFLLELFPKAVSWFIKKILLSLLSSISMGVIIWFGFRLSFFSTDRFTSILHIPYSIIYLGIPLGSSFTLYHILRCIFTGPVYHENIDEELTL